MTVTLRIGRRLSHSNTAGVLEEFYHNARVPFMEQMLTRVQAHEFLQDQDTFCGHGFARLFARIRKCRVGRGRWRI